MSDDQRDRTTVTKSVCKHLVAEVRNGDCEHGLSIAEMLLSEGPSFEPELLIDIVEGVLELAKLAGAKNAEGYLNDKWPVLRKAHLRRLTAKAAG